MKEVEAYALFAPHPNIIHSIDYSVSADRSDPGAKTVYILLPYYRRGNLQDIINANLVNNTKFPERQLMVLFLGVCKALKAMHNYRVQGGPGGVNSQKKAKRVRAEAAMADEDAEEEVGRQARQRGREQDPDSEQQEPLMDGEVTRSQEGVAPGEIRAYAHRDIKPGKYLRPLWPSPNSQVLGNIMIDDDGVNPILMDLGSLAPAPTPITSRSLALAVQDQAAEHSTMPYRAPELFDVKTGSTIDTKVDIWSLGCTLYACLVGKSPFEMRSDETGGSLSICVLGGDWRFPDEGAGGKKKATNQTRQTEDNGISESIRDVVRRCLRVEPSERPDVDQLTEIVERVIEELPEDGSPL
jgi:serine/threonine kinase 16